MAIDGINDTTAAIIAALFGGAGVKLLDKLISRRSTYLAETERLRTELRTEIERLTQELMSTKEDSDEWRKKYWELVESNIQLKTSHSIAMTEIAALREEINTLVYQIELLKNHITPSEE